MPSIFIIAAIDMYYSYKYLACIANNNDSIIYKSLVLVVRHSSSNKDRIDDTVYLWKTGWDKINGPPTITRSSHSPVYYMDHTTVAISSYVKYASLWIFDILIYSKSGIWELTCIWDRYTSVQPIMRQPRSVESVPLTGIAVTHSHIALFPAVAHIYQFSIRAGGYTLQHCLSNLLQSKLV